MLVKVSHANIMYGDTDYDLIPWDLDLWNHATRTIGMIEIEEAHAAEIKQWFEVYKNELYCGPIPTPEVDMTNYYTKTEVDALVTSDSTEDKTCTCENDVEYTFTDGSPQFLDYEFKLSSAPYTGVMHFTFHDEQAVRVVFTDGVPILTSDPLSGDMEWSLCGEVALWTVKPKFNGSTGFITSFVLDECVLHSQHFKCRECGAEPVDMTKFYTKTKIDANCDAIIANIT